jgi:demethylmenaquinone methyltransferase/2-methoxy-6-polyprenyl-1,4-benzoquinol methylase
VSAQVQGVRPGSGAMFDGIAARYDVLNRLMSLGADQRWRRRAVTALNLRPGLRVLDLATGTADVALEIVRQEAGVSVVGVDPSPAMLAIGRSKVLQRGLSASIELLEGDAEKLPFPAGSFDGVTMAFGIRNVPDRLAALREMARVVRPGGRICILELGEPKAGPLSWAARFHVRWAVPRLGALLSGSSEYAYLQRSMALFPGPAEFAGMVAAAGLSVRSSTPLALGACHLFVAEVPGGRA